MRQLRKRSSCKGRFPTIRSRLSRGEISKMREASRPDVSCLRRIVIAIGRGAPPQSRSCSSRTSPPGSARSSISTWMLSTPRWSSATIQSCVARLLPSATAKRKCPDLIFVKPRFDVYKAVWLQIRAIFAEYTPIIEPLSLDEAYLGVTENLKGIVSATQIAETIRAKIRTETGLTASAGVSYNKFLAKLASGHRKPDGLFVITPKMGPAFVERLPVEKFHGIGPVTSEKMNRLGIFTGMDMRNQTLEFMNANFGKAGAYYYWISRGIDERPVRANRVRKSVGAETTFSEDLVDYEALAAELRPLIEKVWRHCETTGARARTATLKVKFSDFELITRSRSVAIIDSVDNLSGVALDLLKQLMPPTKAIRLIGISVSGFVDPEPEDQLPLMFDEAD